jgi:hypothetical protein
MTAPGILKIGREFVLWHKSRNLISPLKKGSNEADTEVMEIPRSVGDD